MDYRELEPDPRLTPWVRCYWQMEADGDGHEPERIIPDGCSELVFHFGDSFRIHHSDGRVLPQPRCLAVGQIRRFVLLEPTGRVGVFGVRFHPAGMHPVLDESSARELRDRALHLDDVRHRLGDGLEDELLEAGDFGKRAANVESRLLSLLCTGKTRPTRVSGVVDLIRASHGDIGIDRLARHSGTSSRQLERDFLREVGITPKTLCRIVRFQGVIDRLQSDDARGWVPLALRCGFFDQSHLIREFNHFTGMTPSHYVAAETPLADCFAGIASRSPTAS